MNSYQLSINYLYGQIPMFQRTGSSAYKDTLDNTQTLDRLYGHPHRAFKTIHVAGTNGKGSVSHMLASVFQEAGYKTGLYTSPHLKDFRERIRINGEMITKQAVVDFVDSFQEKNKTEQLAPSFFELSVAMAFDYFRKETVDIAIIEVGLGGRLDSTNIITPEVSIITNISLDHEALLGNTIGQIAEEKAGIIKPRIPVVIGETEKESASVFQKKATEQGTPLFFADQELSAQSSTLTTDGKQLFNIEQRNKNKYPELKLDLLGLYQCKNILPALKALELLQTKQWDITNKHIYKGFSNVIKNTGLQGRWQTLEHKPLIVCDTGHNESGILQIVEQIENTVWQQLHVVFGMVSDKNIEHILSLLPKKATYYFTKSSVPRALNESELQTKAQKHGLKGSSFKSVHEALLAAKSTANEHDMIFIGGSTFVVADIL